MTLGAALQNDLFRTAAAFVFGAIWGSFLNVCIFRLPRRESVVITPSHCLNCGKPIAAYDNIPIVSYLILRGKCRKCGAPYSAQYFYVELLSALLGGYLGYRAGAQPAPWSFFLPRFILMLISLGCAITDAKHRLIPNFLTYSGIVAGILTGLLLPEFSLHRGALLLAATASTGIFLWLFAEIGGRIAHQEILGRGDVKLAMAIAALTGFRGIVAVLLISSLTATAVGTVIALRHRTPLASQQVPYGIFLGATALVGLLGF